MNPQISNPKDFQVVSFANLESFGFTPEMGCMYDGRAINGKNGSPGIDAGETITLPYHIGHRLATNLAKVAMVKQAPATDQPGVPTGVPLWNDTKLESLKNSYITDLYAEAKPIGMSETDRLMAKVEELKKFVEQNVPLKTDDSGKDINVPSTPQTGYSDKAEVIAELNKRNVKFDARKNKAELEKLLA